MTSEAPSHDHAADRLLAAIDRCRAPVCVGLDPVVSRLPAALAPVGTGPAEAAAAVGRFGSAVLTALAGRVPCVKLQSACFERYRSAGVQVLFDLVAEARERGLEVILDVKRGDIGSTCEQYARAVFDPPGADWVTLSGYLGDDAIAPFLQTRRGIFVLVRTSNPGGDLIQDLPLADGRTVAEAMGEMVARIGDASVGERGYSSVGAVVGATRPEAAESLRRLMPRQIFLVPGVGAQGGRADQILPCFNPDGTGALASASRSVIYAFDPADRSWPDGVARAADALAEAMGRALGLR